MEQEEQHKIVQQSQDKSMIPNKNTFDYKKCNFECRIYKKRMINSQLKYCYINDFYLAICDEPYKKIPDKIIGLTHEVKVQWVYNKTSQPYKLIGFIFKQIGEDVEYLAEEDVLKKIKQVFQKKIFQSKFQDEYEVLSQIGKGNYARVYSIKHRATGEKYAVKCFEKQKLKSLDKGILSLYNELKIMRMLDDHPNVIKLYETFEGENTYYFVMEIVDGTSLYDEIKKHAQKQHTDQEILNIMKMLVDAVAYCAKNNIMHRDLKPENILFASRGNFQELKIVDFGLATIVNEAPYIFPKCGTPGFVAPEIANLVDKSSAYDVICDVFSVGVIFHILLTGDAVFPGKKFNEVLKKNKECVLKFEGPSYEFISKEAKDLLVQMLKKDPQERITAEQAQKHPYFVNNNKKQQKRTNSLEKIKDDSYLDSHMDQVPDVRPKKQSLFTKQPKIPYLKKEDAVDPNHEDLTSLVTKDPIWAGEKQNEFKQKNKMVSQLPDNILYTIGSLDQTNKFDKNVNPQQQKQQLITQEEIKIRKNSASQQSGDKPQQPIKESIKEDDEEIDEEDN